MVVVLMVAVVVEVVFVMEVVVVVVCSVWFVRSQVLSGSCSIKFKAHAQAGAQSSGL